MLNKADSNAMEKLLKEKGYKIVEKEEEADVVVINSCAVKDATEKKQLYRIQNYGKQGKALVVAGCLTYNKRIIRNVNEKAVLVSTGSIEEIDRAVEDAIKGKSSEYLKFKRKRREVIVRKGIAQIAIQEGCTEHCTYCATKLARPLLMSEKPRRIYEMIDEAIKNGAFEIQLTGMDTGAYGIELKTDLAELMKGISSTFKGNKGFRIRIGMLNMVHINRIGSKLIDAFEDTIFYKFFHLPVQSGSDRVLKLMGRRHSIEDFYRAVDEIRRKYENASIATDIIVGFPTETDEDFEETIELIRKVKPDVVNISKFSPRPMTKAYSMEWVDAKKIKERSKKLSEIVKEVGRSKNKRYIGKEIEAMITEEAGEQSKGRTDSYKQVVVEDKINIGKRVKVRIKDFTHTSLIGELIGED